MWSGSHSSLAAVVSNPMELILAADLKIVSWHNQDAGVKMMKEHAPFLAHYAEKHYNHLSAEPNTYTKSTLIWLLLT